jgi:hypothetical protein
MILIIELEETIRAFKGLKRKMMCQIKVRTHYILTPSVLSVCARGPLLAAIAKANSSAC